jgi:hypothetical protein
MSGSDDDATAALRASIKKLEQKLDRANEDAERLASAPFGYGGYCIYCGSHVEHTSDCPIILHRARIAKDEE